jgi:acyl-coenzyme A synthetase/AMP-(fatty) acid ligase
MSYVGHTALQELFDRSGTTELVSSTGTLSPTALHHGANDWSRALRRAGITRGDRIVCALPNGPAFAQLLVAALADGVTLAPVSAQEDVGALLPLLDARIAVTETAVGPHISAPSRTGGPPPNPLEPRGAAARSDGIVFLMRTSGTTGAARWIALSEAGVLAVACCARFPGRIRSD